MKTKHIILIFVIGIIFNIVGALFKITHWHISWITGNVLLAYGSVIEIIAALLFLYKLFTRNKFKDFLDS